MTDVRYGYTIYELKEKAKWSNERTEKIAAVKELAKYGSDAVPSLDEIFMVTISEDIRVACDDAIKAIREKSAKHEIISNVAEKGTQA